MNCRAAREGNYTSRRNSSACATVSTAHPDGDDHRRASRSGATIAYVFGVTHISPGYCYRCPFGLKYPSCNVACARELEDVISTTTSGKIAAFIAEPIRDLAA